MQRQPIKVETLREREVTVGQAKAGIIAANPAFDIQAHIVDMYNWRALDMALKATGKEA